MAVQYRPTDIRGLTWLEQTNFGTVGAGSHAECRARNITFEPTQNIHFAEYQKAADNRGPDQGAMGAEGGTLKFEIPLRGGGGSVPLFMELCQGIGTYTNYNSATQVAAGATTSSVPVDSAAGLAVGMAIMIQLGGSGTPEIRFISDVNGTTLTVEPAFSSAPSENDALLDIATLHSNAISGETGKYYQFKFYAGDKNSHNTLYTLTDCVVSWKINSAAVDTLPFIEVTAQCDSWSITINSLLTVAADSDGSTPQPMLGSNFYIDDTATEIESFEFDPALNIVPIKDMAGTNGRSGWFCTGNQPSVKFKPYYDVTWYTKWQTPTTFQLFLESVKDTDDGWAWYAPSCQVTNISQSDIEGLAAMEPEIMLLDPGTATTGGEYIPRWAIAITSA